MKKITGITLAALAAGAGAWYYMHQRAKKAALGAGQRSGAYIDSDVWDLSEEQENTQAGATAQSRQDSEVMPADITTAKAEVTYGKVVKCTYYSTTRGRETNVNVLLPPGYTTEERYPVLYALHGFWGNEDALLGMSKAQNVLGNMIARGEAQKMIVVFPYIYTSKSQAFCTHMDQENALNYDNFIHDLVKDLMPYIEANYSVKTGRDNTAITGFSMGGRESLYIGVRLPELFGYIGAVCPAPGLTPGHDSIMGEHSGQLQEAELAFASEEVTPKLLLLTAGTADTVVCEHPERYHNILTENDVEHMWQHIAEAGHDASSVVPHMYEFMKRVFR